MRDLVRFGILMQDPFETTSTTTTTATLTVNWYYEGLTCNDGNSGSVFKNSVNQGNAAGPGAYSGSFTCVVGDVLSVEYTTGDSALKGCTLAQAAIETNAGQVAFDSAVGINTTATATWTVTSGTTFINLFSGAVV